MAIEDGYLSSPASTPDTSFDEEKFLVKRFHAAVTDSRRRITANKGKWYYELARNVPVAILCVSLLQILFHIYATSSLKKYLRFEPSKRLELWRYVTYMLVHEDWSHLVLNVVIQCIFAALLEINQGRLRVLAIYTIGGVTGVLGAACLHSELIVGASAGGYALLLANVADLVLNFETIKYKIYRSISITTLILFDIIYDIVHVTAKKEPQVSWQAHFFGGLTGIFLGLVLFKCQKPTKYRKPLFYIGLGFYTLFVFGFIVFTIQIVKCTPSDLIHYKYVYFC
ncbi:protein rhomboid [Anthonomus grandis grandis]|uniref:protein rhomboid n=1 Tax=Anthonomus grandis grandis TaxID=2921223 RepID=UPI002166A364|nr:protein rhomboid [Anthonomus grandis grandis]XP_050310218.1 protein rhomboid [Anthonomus grandis grandis]